MAGPTRDLHYRRKFGGCVAIVLVLSLLGASLTGSPKSFPMFLSGPPGLWLLSALSGDLTQSLTVLVPTTLCLLGAAIWFVRTHSSWALGVAGAAWVGCPLLSWTVG